MRFPSTPRRRTLCGVHQGWWIVTRPVVTRTTGPDGEGVDQKFMRKVQPGLMPTSARWMVPGVVTLTARYGNSR